MDITVVEHTKNARQNRYLGTDKEIFKPNAGDLLPLEELTVVLDIEHLDSLKAWVVHDTVGTDDVGLLVVPLSLKSVLLLGQSGFLLHHHRDSLTISFLLFKI